MAGSTVSNISIAVTANAAPAIAGLKVVQKELASVGKTASKSRNSVKAFGVELQGKGGANKKVRSVLQQTGYQFGDFAVQVGGGTSAMQAFGQQAPQLLQVFGPWGSIIGAGVAIFAAIAVAIQKTSAASKEAVPKIKSVKEGMDLLNASASAVAATFDTSLRSSLLDASEKFGHLSSEMLALLDVQRQLTLAVDTSTVSAVADSLSDSIPGIKEYRELVKELAVAAADSFRKVAETSERAQKNFASASGLIIRKMKEDIPAGVIKASNAFEVFQDALKSGNTKRLTAAILVLDRVLDGLTGVSEEQRLKLVNLAKGQLEVVRTAEKAAEANNKLTTSYTLLGSSMETFHPDSKNQDVTKALSALNKQIALEEAINGLMAKGLGIQDARTQATNDALRAAVALGGTNGALASVRIRLNEALAVQREQIKAAKEHLALVKSFKEEMAAANAAANTVGSDLAPLLRELARLEALKSGVAQTGRAGVIADLQARIEALKKELGLAEKVKKIAEETRTFADTLKDAQNEALILGETLSIMKSEGVTSEIASEMAKAAIAFKTTAEEAAALQSVLSEIAKTAAQVKLAAAPGLARQEFADAEAAREEATDAAVNEMSLLMGGMGPDAAATLGALQARWAAVGLSIGEVTANTEKFLKSTEKLSQAKLHIEMFKTLADTVNNSFATALDSIVTRTKSVKDAFSDMGRDILRTISRLLMSSAMQGFTKMLSGGKSGGGGGPFGLITGVLSSLFGGGAASSATADAGAASWLQPNAPILNAKGNAFSGGSIIPFAKGGVFANDNIVPFANGGIVSRATMFPMNNGIGKMAEAGPEAIIPLSRGSDGKLGVSGGGTTVNQTINVTTGIQQTVRAEIQSLMPQIAAASTKAVLDARRRGGSFAGAFG